MRRPAAPRALERQQGHQRQPVDGALTATQLHAGVHGDGGLASDTMTVTVGSPRGASSRCTWRPASATRRRAGSAVLRARSRLGADRAAHAEEVDQYLEDRRLKGFNTLLVQLIVHGLAFDPPSFHAPNNVYGVGRSPCGDFATPNEAYFAMRVRHRQGREKGILVLLARPTWLQAGQAGTEMAATRGEAARLRPVRGNASAPTTTAVLQARLRPPRSCCCAPRQRHP